MEEISAALNALPEAFLVLTRSGVIDFANQQAAGILGSPRTQLVGQSLENFVREPQSELAALIKQWGRSGQLLPAVLTIGRLGNASVKYRCEGARLELPGAEGRLLVRIVSRDASIARFISLNERIEALGREITRRRRVETTLEEQRKLIQVTLSSIGDAVIATDETGRITFLNTVAEQLTQWTMSEALARPLHEVFVIRNEDNDAPVTNPVDKVIQSGGIVGLANHTLLIRRDGMTLPIDDSAAPIRDEGGRIFGVVLVFRDISERRAVERAKQEADRRKDEFLAMLAHELRNPLAVIANNVQLLQLAIWDPLPEKERRQLHLIGNMLGRQTTHLTRLVDDLLDASRITSGRMSLRRSTQQLGPIVIEAVEMAKHKLDERSIDLRIGIAAEPIWVHADCERLAQVFSNLLTNAAKFSPPGSRVDVEVDSSAGAAIVRVRDEGIGLEPHMFDSIFEFFRQVDSSAEQAEGGLGVGLAIVKRIVELHGGTIEVSSQGLGRGSEFRVSLPAAIGS